MVQRKGAIPVPRVTMRLCLRYSWGVMSPLRRLALRLMFLVSRSWLHSPLYILPSVILV